MSHRLGAPVIDIATPSATVLARHRLEPDGAGVLVRDSGYVAALQTAVLAAFGTRTPCPRKVRRPPSPAALAQAEHLRARRSIDEGDRDVVVDLAVWAPRRPRQAGRAMTITTAPEPTSSDQASAYQRLRAHLAYLKLPTAAEHLPPAPRHSASPPPWSGCSPWRLRPPRTSA